MTLEFWKGMWWCQLMKIWIIQTISNIFHTSKRFAYLLQLFLTKEWQLAKSFKCFVSRLNSDIGISKKYLDKTVIITYNAIIHIKTAYVLFFMYFFLFSTNTKVSLVTKRIPLLYPLTSKKSWTFVEKLFSLFSRIQLYCTLNKNIFFVC